MNLLLDGLPHSVEINGRDVPINTDYRAGLKFAKVLKDPALSNADKLRKAILLYFAPDALRYGELEPAVDALIDFYRCGTPKPPQGSAEQEEEPEQEQAYDYEHDAGYIYAAFKQAYGVDLATNNLHWWQFRALFQSLPDDTMFVKIIGYRTAKVPPKASAEQRQRIEELRRVYALPLPPDQQQLQTDLIAILRNGGNPAALLGGAERSCHSMAP